MIHRIKEGERMWWGLNIGRGYIGVRLYRRFELWFGKHYGIKWYIDLTRDHRMYRPSDMDTPYVVCRRCGQANNDCNNFCSGTTYWRRP